MHYNLRLGSVKKTSNFVIVSTIRRKTHWMKNERWKIHQINWKCWQFFQRKRHFFKIIIKTPLSALPKPFGLQNFINSELEHELQRNASFGIWDYVWLVQWSTEKDWFVYTTWICTNTCNKCVRKVADLEFDVIEYKPLQSIDMETSVQTDMYFQQYE